MIYFCCGAPKNGSHFQYNLIKEAFRLKGIPYEVTNTNLFHAYDYEKGRALLSELDKDKDKKYLCKGHWGSRKARDILLSNKNIKIFLIWRDVRDVLVSDFFYAINKKVGNYKDFQDYYWNKGGRRLACAQKLYQEIWREPEGRKEGRKKIFEVSFEDLKKDFQFYAGNMLRRINVDGINMAELEENISVEKLGKSNPVFYRKGIVGENKEVINDSEIYEDLENIQMLPEEALRRIIDGSVIFI